jgi:cephalosporin hydroxylase
VRLILDTETRLLIEESGEGSIIHNLYSDEAYELLSQQWLRVGWNQKYTYTFSWLGRPVIQLPEDLIRVQEVIYRVRPDVVLETGVAHGGSLIYYAGLCKTLGRGRVIGVDIEIRPHNRQAIEAHFLAGFITLIEGDAVAPETIEKVKALIKPGESVLVLLDSNHTKAHVLAELGAYHDVVSPGSYIVATDGIMKDLADVPRGKPEWLWDNPAAAAVEFSETHPEFVIEQPAWPFHESSWNKNITHWPRAWLRRQSLDQEAA